MRNLLFIIYITTFFVSCSSKVTQKSPEQENVTDEKTAELEIDSFEIMRQSCITGFTKCLPIYEGYYHSDFAREINSILDSSNNTCRDFVYMMDRFVPTPKYSSDVVGSTPGVLWNPCIDSLNWSVDSVTHYLGTPYSIKPIEFIEKNGNAFKGKELGYCFKSGDEVTCDRTIKIRVRD